jgi:quercetin dioxygenase-like cupin family protein
MKTKLFLFAIMAVSGLALGTAVVMAQGGNGAVMKEARVTQVVKDVKILSTHGEPRPASLSDTVRGDTAVRTGAESRAELTFGDLSIARLGANTIFSFNEGSRTVELGNGAILLRVPKGSGGAKIQTAAVTAAITGTTVIAEYHPKSYAKYLVLEGTMRIYLKGVLGESILLNPGQMLIVNPNATRLPEPVDFDLERLLQTSLFIQGYRPLPSEPLMASVQHNQLEQKTAGDLIDTNLVIFGRGTLVTLTDPQSLDVIDRKTAAVTLPTPTPTATAPPPKPSPTATATATIPPPTPTATIPPPTPTPSKFGPPPPIVTSVPYPIDNGTTIQTDPTITRAGVTDFGKIYRDSAQDGPFSTWAFTATSPFDTTTGIDDLYGPNAPVAAFKFVAIQLVGDPIISTANGGALNLALISVGPITSAPAGNASFTFAGMQSVLIATQAGSIDISGPDILFRDIPTLIFYARGTGSNLTLGGMGIFNVSNLRLIAENNILINSPESLAAGSNGGILRGTAGGGLTVNSPIDTPTAFIASGTSGNGGLISLTALGGTLTVNSRIQTSYNDPSASVAGPLVRRSAQGGPIDLFSGLTTGTGINVTSGASLLTLLNPAAPGPGGSITLFTAGSDIVVDNATLQADRGSIGIGHTAAPPTGTALITLNGGTFSSELLAAISSGNLTVGTTSPVNISAVTLGFLATNNVTWNGGTSSAAAVNSPGDVTLQAGNDLLITGATTIDRSNGGGTLIKTINLTLTAGRNFQTQGLSLTTDGSGLTSGANISLTSGGTMTTGGPTRLQAEIFKANQGTGSNISISSGGAITMTDLLAFAGLGFNGTLGNGANVSLTGASFTATDPQGGFRLGVINFSGGTITTGGNISLSLNGILTTGTGGAFSLAVTNPNGTIQTGGNINSNITGNVSTNLLNVQIDNRTGLITSGGSITFNVNGTVTTGSDANIEILNSLPGTPGGKIGSATFINATLGSTSIGGDLNVFVDNSDGSIGPGGDDWTVTLKINGTLSVTGRINVYGDLTSTGAVTAGQLSATNINAPSIAVGSGGITRFSYPNEINTNPPHTITTNALTSTGGINFNGADYDPSTGFGPFDAGQLTINVPSLTIGPSPADNIQGAVTFNGGASTITAISPGSGGTFTVNATGNITVNSAIEATTGLQNSSSETGGTGGTVNLNSTTGTVAVNAPITVSSAEPATGVPRRHSSAGGNINLQSNSTGVAININNTGQLLSLLEATAPGPGGKITVLATGTGSRITVNGDPGAAGRATNDTIRADKGTVDIRNTGGNGLISLTNAQIAADTVKVGALGSNGTLSIGGGRISADTMLQLYATGSNGSVIFVSNVLLTGNSMKIIAGNTVTVNNGVVVEVGPTKADIYVPSLNNANYSNAYGGGNGSTTGVFILEGTSGSPTSGANTHVGVAPPPFVPAPGGH